MTALSDVGKHQCFTNTAPPTLSCSTVMLSYEPIDVAVNLGHVLAVTRTSGVMYRDVHRHGGHGSGGRSFQQTDDTGMLNGDAYLKVWGSFVLFVWLLCELFRVVGCNGHGVWGEWSGVGVCGREWLWHIGKVVVMTYWEGSGHDILGR
jgi:hypothetical protein